MTYHFESFHCIALLQFSLGSVIVFVAFYGISDQCVCFFFFLLLLLLSAQTPTMMIFSTFEILLFNAWSFVCVFFSQLFFSFAVVVLWLTINTLHFCWRFDAFLYDFWSSSYTQKTIIYSCIAVLCDFDLICWINLHVAICLREIDWFLKLFYQIFGCFFVCCNQSFCSIFIEKL